MAILPSLVCSPHLYEAIEGDLLERYDADVETVGARRARRRLAWNVIKFFRPGIVLRNQVSNNNVFNMILFRNYFKVATRTLWKQKLHSVINLVGLSVGMACCMLLYLYILNERSYDQFNENKDRIFLIGMERKNLMTMEGESTTGSRVEIPLKTVVQNETPSVQYATHYAKELETVKQGDHIFKDEITYVDNDFLKMFSFPIVSGDVMSALSDLNHVVITASAATKYFGNEDPVGKHLTISNKPYVVSALVQDPPYNSSVSFSLLLPSEARPIFKRLQADWGALATSVFIQVKPETDKTVLTSTLNAVYNKHTGPIPADVRKQRAIPDSVQLVSLFLVPLPNLHFDTSVHWANSTNPIYLYILAGIAVLILLLASLNYIILSLSTSVGRIREVGIRKSIGALSRQLRTQYTSEAVLMALLAFILACCLVVLVLPVFNTIAGKQVLLDSGMAIRSALGGLVLVLLIGFIAGSYPAFFLSRKHPALIVQGSSSASTKSTFIRPLVIMQYALSSFLMICALVMYHQMRFIDSRDLGFDADQVLVVDMNPKQTEYSRNLLTEFRQALNENPHVVSVAGANQTFSNRGYAVAYEMEGVMKTIWSFTADENYIPMLGLNLKQGRNFNPDGQSDRRSIIVNEAMVDLMGWDDPLNKTFSNIKRSKDVFRVIGVLENYNFHSLNEQIQPMLLTIDDTGPLGVDFYEAYVKITPGSLPGAIEEISQTWKKLFPGKPFTYSFLDEDVAAAYQTYVQQTRLMGWATGFAILISCLGLFGLAGINATNRTKEIGIRKVMGASVAQVLALLNRQFVWLAVLAFVIAAPVAWFLMNQWLSEFAYRIELGWGLFALSLCLALMMALLAVSFQTIRAATVNPVDSLRNE